MRVHLELFDRDGARVSEQRFESPLVSIGSGAEDDFAVPGVSPGAGEIRWDPNGRGVLFRAEDRPAILVDRSREFALGALTLRVTPLFTSDAAAPEGYCPRCRVPMQDAVIGGAYRSFARRELACNCCGGALLDLEATASAVGAFADASAHDWVQVVVPLSCPRCLQPMIRARLVTARGSAEVERCVRCRLVFLEQADRARLHGQP